LDADAMRALIGQAKKQIRGRMRAVRSALPRSAVAARSARIVENLKGLAAIREARTLASFWPMASKNEVDLCELDAWARAEGKRLYYPFMDPSADGYQTGFRALDEPKSLSDRGRGFSEPPPDAPQAGPGDIDVVIVPALAVSEDGYRIGYGIGFYDATLPDVRPPARTVCVAFSFQLVVEVPHEAHDIACDWLVTDERVAQSTRAVP